LISKNLKYYGTYPFKRRQSWNGDSFDRQHGTDTAGIREIGSLGIHSANAVYAVRYEVTGEGVALRALSSVPADVSTFSLVDYGCGKGKILLLASEHSYRSLIGVEFAPELVNIARRNVAAFERSKGKDCHITVLCADVVDYDPPEGHLVAYLYNPFDCFVVKKVEEKLRQSALRSGCDIFVIYVDPVHKCVWQDQQFWQVVVEDEVFIVYRSSRLT